jgi:carboxymethylenebutenolidase
MNTTGSSSNGLTAAQQALSDLWDEHVRYEFATKDPLGAVNTMVPDGYVNHIPVLTGGVGREHVEAFYSQYLILQAPPDIEIILISRTIGVDRLVDELMLERFLQDVEES